MPFTNILMNTLDTVVPIAESVTENINEIIPDDIVGQLGYGLKIALIGIGMVFLVLILLMLILYIFKFCFYTIPNKVHKAKKAPTVNEKELTVVSSDEDEAELIAVLTAAIAAYEGNSDATSRYKIRSFKRI